MKKPAVARGEPLDEAGEQERRAHEALRDGEDVRVVEQERHTRKWG